VTFSKCASLAVLAACVLVAAGCAPPPVPPPSSTTTTVPPSVVEVAGGGYFTCARYSDARLRCWGQGDEGALGYGSLEDRLSPGDPLDLLGVTAVGAGSYTTCAVAGSDAHVECWGRGDAGNLGNGSFANSSSPVRVSGLTGVTQIALGETHVCALSTSATVSCWGNNGLGQLGNGTTASSATPQVVPGLTGVRSIAAGVYSQCALLNTGGVRCWGWNDSGQVGNGVVAQKFTSPQVVSSLGDAVALMSGNTHVCALRADGTVQCWGSNGRGELGTGSTGGAQRTPRTVTGLAGVEHLAEGSSPAGAHTCASTASAVYCWGWNGSGQLGVGDTTNRSTPSVVSGVAPGPVRVGGSHTIALRSGVTSRVWGRNFEGQLGLGSAGDFALVPVAAPF